MAPTCSSKTRQGVFLNDKNDYTKYQWYLENAGDSQYIADRNIIIVT